MAQQGLSDAHRNKCGHEGCACLVAPSEHYCSEHCATASKANVSGTLPGQAATGGACRCGHDACKTH